MIVSQKTEWRAVSKKGRVVATFTTIDSATEWRRKHLNHPCKMVRVSVLEVETEEKMNV